MVQVKSDKGKGIVSMASALAQAATDMGIAVDDIGDDGIAKHALTDGDIKFGAGVLAAIDTVTAANKKAGKVYGPKSRRAGEPIEGFNGEREVAGFVAGLAHAFGVDLEAVMDRLMKLSDAAIIVMGVRWGRTPADRRVYSLRRPTATDNGAVSRVRVDVKAFGGSW